MIKYRRNEGEKMGKGVFYKINNDTITIFPDTFDYVLPSREVIRMINEQKIKNVIIGDGIVRIPLKFFENCYSISKVILPATPAVIPARWALAESARFKATPKARKVASQMW